MKDLVVLVLTVAGVACAAPKYNRRPSESYGQSTNSYDTHGPGPLIGGPGPLIGGGGPGPFIGGGGPGPLIGGGGPGPLIGGGGPGPLIGGGGPVVDVVHSGPVVDVHPGLGYDHPHPPPYNNRLTVRACREGEVLRGDGVCQHPEVTRRVYVYTPPVTPRSYIPPPALPKPRVHTNVLIIRTPEDEERPPPVVVPQAAQKNVIYVLDKKQDLPQRVIEVPQQPHHKPDVFFVHYKDGENPILHDGTDLHSALGAAGVGSADGYGGGVGHADGYGGGNIVPDITLAGSVGLQDGPHGINANHDVILDTGYGGNAGHDVVVNTGYGGNVGHDIVVDTGYGGNVNTGYGGNVNTGYGGNVNTGYGGNVNTHPY